MKEIAYTSIGLPVRKAYRDKNQLIVQPEATLPDVCIACGGPARGRKAQANFAVGGNWSLFLPPILDVIVESFVSRLYVFELPFCGCNMLWPYNLLIKKARLDDWLGVFEGVASSFLDSLPAMPPEVAAEKSRDWLQRRFRWLRR